MAFKRRSESVNRTSKNQQVVRVWGHQVPHEFFKPEILVVLYVTFNETPTYYLSVQFIQHFSLYCTSGYSESTIIKPGTYCFAIFKNFHVL